MRDTSRNTRTVRNYKQKAVKTTNLLDRFLDHTGAAFPYLTGGMIFYRWLLYYQVSVSNAKQQKYVSVSPDDERVAEVMRERSVKRHFHKAYWG